MTTAPISYNIHNSATRKVLDHLNFLLPDNIARTLKGENQPIPPNRLESWGNRGLQWIPQMSRAYKALNQFISDPTVLLIAFSALSLIAIQFMFYPFETLQRGKNIQNFFILILPSYEVVKFWSYVALIEVSFSYSLRAAGRLFNQTLKENFYSNNLV